MSTRSYYVYAQGQKLSESGSLPFPFKVCSTEFSTLSLYTHVQEWFQLGKAYHVSSWHSQQKAFLHHSFMKALPERPQGSWLHICNGCTCS